MKFNEKYLRYSLYLLVVVLFNVAAGSLFFRFDLTANGVYSLSDTSRDAVSELKEPLTIKAYFSRNLPAPYNNLETEVGDLLGEYAAAGNRFFSYEVLSIDTEDGTAPEILEARDYGINPIQIQKVERDEVNLVNAYMGMVFIHGDRVETINALGSGQNLEFTLTSTIKDMTDTVSALLSLEEDIRADLYLSPILSGVFPDLDSYATELASALAGANTELYGRLAYDRPVFDTPTNPRSLFGITGLVLRGPEGESEAFAELIVSKGENGIPVRLLRRGLLGYSFIDVSEVVETVKTAALRLAGVNPSLAYLTGNGTTPLNADPYAQQQDMTANIGNFVSALGRRYTLAEVDVETDALPSGTKTLLVVSPSEPFSDLELFRIDQFLMAGNSVAFFIDTHTEIIDQQASSFFGPQATYVPRNTGLEKLLAHYGMGVRKTYVFDEKAFKQQSRNASGGIDEMTIYTAPEIDSSYINHDLPGMRTINNLLVLNASPVEKLPSEAGQATAVPVFSSSDTSWEQTKDFNLAMPMLITPPTAGSRATYPLAYYAEGIFTSFFKDRPAPLSPEAGQDGVTEPVTVIDRTDQGRIFLIGTSSILSDALFDQNATSSNAVLVLNMIDILNGDADFAVMRSKGQSFVPLNDAPNAARSAAKTAGIFVIPALSLVVGVLTWFARRRRQRWIRDEFSPEARA